MPKVSVIVPIYDVEKYIERCLRSLFEQTLDDIEYIFVNDCTPDNSMIILEKVLEEYPHRKKQVKIINHEQNQGQAGARTSGMKAMTGEYMVHCDPDDWVELDMYESMYQKAKAEDYDIVWCDFSIITNNSKFCSKQVSNLDKISIFKQLLISRPFIGSLCNRIIKRELVFDKRIIKPITQFCEDLVLVFQYTLHGEKFGYISTPFYNYRQHNESVTNSNRDFQAQLNRFIQTKKNFDIIEKIINNDFLLKEQLKNELLWHKYIKKERFLPYINSINSCKYWINIYPEINKKIFINPYISFKSKIISALILLRLYPLLKYFR